MAQETNSSKSAAPTVVDVLLAKFAGRILIPFPDAIEAMGYKRQTARNELTRGDFPVPSLLQGSRRYIAITDLAEYLERVYATRDQPKVKKKIGRPTKVAQIAARNANVAA